MLFPPKSTYGKVWREILLQVFIHKFFYIWQSLNHVTVSNLFSNENAVKSHVVCVLKRWDSHSTWFGGHLKMAVHAAERVKTGPNSLIMTCFWWAMVVTIGYKCNRTIFHMRESYHNIWYSLKSRYEARLYTCDACKLHGHACMLTRPRAQARRLAILNNSSHNGLRITSGTHTQHGVTNYRSFLSFSAGNTHGKKHQKDHRYICKCLYGRRSWFTSISKGMGISELLFF